MSTGVQLVRFALVGLLTNVLAYLLYLGLTVLGLGPKTAMSLLFVFGMLQSFVFNRRWTFRSDGRVDAALQRYGVVYGLAYLMNLLLMRWLVDGLGWPHQAVFAGLMVLVPLLTFAGQKLWVFRDKPAATEGA